MSAGRGRWTWLGEDLRTAWAGAAWVWRNWRWPIFAAFLLLCTLVDWARISR